MRRIAFDLETDGLLPWQPKGDLTKIHCICLEDVDRGDKRTLLPNINGGWDEAIMHLSAADVLIGHNIVMYDLPVLELILDWKPRPGQEILDTQLLSRLIWPDMKTSDFKFLETRKGREFPKQLIGQHSLKAWGYRLGNLKGTFGETEDWSVCTPEMIAYCEQDVSVTCDLFRLEEQKIPSEQAVELEHRFAELISEQIQNGFPFDEEAAEQLLSKLQQRRLQLVRDAQGIFPPKEIHYVTPKLKQEKTRIEVFNPTSRKQVGERMMEKGWQPSEFTNSGAPKVDETVLEEMVEKGFEEAKILAELFLLTKRIGQLHDGQNGWLKLVKNGRIHGQVITNGTVTGRCAHHKPNVGQVPAVYSPYGEECRSLFMAPEGYSLVGCDASGLELRCLAHYLHRHDGGEYEKIILEGDIHTANQEAAGLETRDQAKTFIYGWLYGAGEGKIGQIVGGGVKEGKALKKRFLDNLPALKKLRAGVESAAKSRGWLKGLDGRILPIRSSHTALNTLLQSAGAVLMKQATINLHALSPVPFQQVAHVHDEFQSLVETGSESLYGDAAVAAIATSGEPFGFRCRLDAEWKSGRNWAATH